MEKTKRLLFGSTKWGTAMRIILLLTVGLFPLFREYGFTLVIGTSMEPTHNNGELVIVHKTDRSYTPAKYDVVCIQVKDEKWIKRVIGLPGDTIYINDYIYVNNIPLTDVVGEIVELKEYQQQLVVPTSCVWIIGDNEEVSAHGIFPSSFIIGKVVY
jgi:signal peptidase I